ncbi:hypothetical protein Ancab_019649 [Ancistrocladus abbreviatus]
MGDKIVIDIKLLRIDEEVVGNRGFGLTSDYVPKNSKMGGSRHSHQRLQFCSFKSAGRHRRSLYSINQVGAMDMVERQKDMHGNNENVDIPEELGEGHPV